MKDHYAFGLVKHLCEIWMNHFCLTPSMPRFQERSDHVALHWTWTKERDIDHQVVKTRRSKLAYQLSLPRTFYLKDAESLSGLNQIESLFVIEC
ncbi:MAG: hypothetical protein JW384_02409 [Nitrosomonadaceae bacterium]|nr:hypothetical protein [Nitrosomonadaceae bacterium]